MANRLAQMMLSFAVAHVATSQDTIHYTLVVTICHLRMGDLDTWTRCYNGTVPGPTLRVKPGQTLRISLVNELSAHDNTEYQVLNTTGYGEAMSLTDLKREYNDSSWEEAEGTGSLFGLPNTTNLHMHGLVVSGASPADDVMMAVKPGDVFQYAYEVPPHHMGGTLWYHPHHHHSTTGQANGGMFGALLVEDPPASLPPSIMQAEERLMLVNTLDVGMQRSVARMSMDDLWQTNSSAVVSLVNGTFEPNSSIQSGKWYRLRFVYASMFHSVRLALRGSNATCRMSLLAKDGVYLKEAPRVVNRIWLASGNRADVMVSCSCHGAEQCRATFQSEWGPRNSAEFKAADAHWNGLAVTRTWVGNVFHLDIAGNSDAATLPVFHPRMPCYLADLTSLSSSQLSPGNRVNVSMFWEQKDPNGFRGEHSNEYDHEYQTIINGQFGMIFNNTRDRMMSDHQRAAGTLPFDEVQEWTVQGVQYHPFHTHGQPYQIAAMATKEQLMETLVMHNQDESVPLEPYLNDTIRSLIEDDDGWFKVGDWHDTFHDLGSQVVVRVAPRIPNMSTMVFHCHYLNHEDQGMMTYVDVESGSSTCTTGAQCAKSLDPTCYSGSVGAGFTLKDATRNFRR